MIRVHRHGVLRFHDIYGLAAPAGMFTIQELPIPLRSMNKLSLLSLLLLRLSSGLGSRDVYYDTRVSEFFRVAFSRLSNVAAS